ncbi:MAG: YceI family protein [Pyrinomonadaceae bacterium]
MIIIDETPTVRYKLDASKSAFTVQAFASGFLSGLGHNPVIAIRDFTGEVEFAPETLADASLRLEVNAKSLEVLSDIKEKDKQEIQSTMLEQVLETSRYTEIVFQSTSIAPTRIVPGRYKARIIGDLTLHGVTNKNLWLSAQLTLNENELRAKGDFALNQTAYGIEPVSVAAGALKLKDELKFEFDLVGYQE